MALPVTVAVEGASDVPVLRKVLEHCGCTIHVVHGRAGKGQIDRNLKGYNNAARYSPWVVLRDLDHDAQCPKALVDRLLPAPAHWMRLRIAVREIESWLLADPERMARFLRLRRRALPGDLDQLADPKQALVNLARQSPISAIRQDMVPAPGTSGSVGPAYVSRITEFAKDHWRPAVAVRNSESLRRSVDRIGTLLEYVAQA